MRGKLLKELQEWIPVRITPADAGKTVRVCIRRVAIQDHPRGCGENDSTALKAEADAGSPPRMRGKQICSCVSPPEYRITPADAGKTLPRPTSSATFWDHPRGCGENSMLSFPIFSASGSPPRMRGKLSCRKTYTLSRGITPADAGKTGFTELTGDGAKDHPRGCGENSRRLTVSRLNSGSPPRMRGKPFVVCAGCTTLGITPADAGKTSPAPRAWYWTRDHPRGCGENTKKIL